MKLPDNTFGRMLAQMRRNRGWSRECLAHAVGLKQWRIREVECGYRVPLCNANIVKVAACLAVPAVVLIQAADKTRAAYLAARQTVAS